MGLTESIPIRWINPSPFVKTDLWNHTWYPSEILTLKRLVRSPKHKYESIYGPGAKQPQYYNVFHNLYAIYKKRGDGTIHIDMCETAKNGSFVDENVKIELLEQTQNGLKVKLKITLTNSATSAKQEFTHIFWRYNFIIDI
tara:strand:+ start:2223 stop:2645 length:423 start_codon:yes stop_codon:yes gene_type:complete